MSNPKGIRFPKDIEEFINKQREKEGRTFSNMVVHFLRNEKNRTENKERKEKE